MAISLLGISSVHGETRKQNVVLLLELIIVVVTILIIMKGCISWFSLSVSKYFYKCGWDVSAPVQDKSS